MIRNTFAEIDLQAIRNNYIALSELSPQSKSLAVVKADAYGNGAVAAARALEKHTSMFCVAIYEEAIELRNAGITHPIVVLQGPNSPSHLVITKQQNIHWVLHNPLQLDWFRDANKKTPLNGHQWIKFDTGMHRLGFQPSELSEIKENYPDVFSEEAVIMTHLACADEDDTTSTSAQLDSFLSIVNTLKNPTSIANSAGTIAHSAARASFNRLGITMYGASPFSSSYAGNTPKLAPVMRFCAPVIALREIPTGDAVGYGATWKATRKTKIATVAAGYADGYPRHAPSGTPAWLNGATITLAGRVSMDMITFDVTDVDSVTIGDVVELWGPNNAINEVAEYSGTIGYELMTRLSKRVPRRYINK